MDWQAEYKEKTGLRAEINIIETGMINKVEINCATAKYVKWLEDKLTKKEEESYRCTIGFSQKKICKIPNCLYAKYNNITDKKDCKFWVKAGLRS